MPWRYQTLYVDIAVALHICEHNQDIVMRSVKDEIYFQSLSFKVSTTPFATWPRVKECGEDRKVMISYTMTLAGKKCKHQSPRLSTFNLAFSDKRFFRLTSATLHNCPSRDPTTLT